MALTLQARMTASVIDSFNVMAEITTYCLVDPTVVLSAIVTTYTAWLANVDAVSGGKIIRATLTLYPAIIGLKGSPVAGSVCSQTGLLAFTGPSSTRRDSVAVAALLDTLIVDNKIVTGSGAVATFIAFLQSGGSSLEPTTSDFDGPVVFKDSTIAFRKYRDQLGPLSFNLS